MAESSGTRRGGATAADAPAPGMLSIGALARVTGLSIDTLRTWERRYGFPAPCRKPSGHRLYPAGSVGRLRRIAAALALGHRAGQVVCASDDDLGVLLGVHTTVHVPHVPPGPCQASELLELVSRFDADALVRRLNAEWGRLGPLAFLEERVAPLVCAVGEAWACGRLQIRHEHFLSERLGDLLRTYRLPFEDRAHGPLVVLATLPGEAHALGLQMAALVVATSGCRPCYVGTDVPVAEIASVACDLGARAIGISVSSAMRRSRSTALLAALRRRVPGRVAIVAGGAGMEGASAAVRTMTRLGDLASFATALRAAAT